MIASLAMGLDLHVAGLPSWMEKMNPNKISKAQRGRIVSVNFLGNRKCMNDRIGFVFMFCSLMFFCMNLRHLLRVVVEDA